ncbi:hypothetical protein BT69DRAFT_1257438 [Atractiella rhizophila]|nr:hypothetical protein BT69DRAFT_1269306 [Atractiella rhizophila]KAH8928332.1 hypothetical protein BT69DRAFT_1257438 [Atractiella rhizophila]
MSVPPIQGEKSLSGATTNLNGDRVVASSRRPDGTYRKELKIRPGFMATEDVAKFRSARQQDIDARQNAKGRVPGMVPGAGGTTKVQVTLEGSAKKNQKRKEKRKEKKDEEDVPDAWDEEETETKKTEEKPAVDVTKEDKTESGDKEETKDDIEKRLKAIRKKLRQASQLKDSQNSGTQLLPEQQAKVDQLADFQDELELLEGKLASLSVG